MILFLNVSLLPAARKSKRQNKPKHQDDQDHQEKKIEDPLDDLSSGCMVKARYHQSNGGKTFIVNHTTEENDFDNVVLVKMGWGWG